MGPFSLVQTKGMLAFFHTAPANAHSFEAIAQEISPGIATRHVVREDLLDRAREASCVSDALVAEIAAAIESSIEPGDRVMLCTCSSIGGGADRARHPRVPILRVDRPMAQLAVGLGKRILVAACLESTIAPTVTLLKGEGDGLDIETLLIESAWHHWSAGEPEAYWAAIAAMIKPQIEDFDAVVLAQASMAGAAALLGAHATPVLSSPRLGVAAAIKRVDASR
jgi:hypothetical protein